MGDGKARFSRVICYGARMRSLAINELFFSKIIYGKILDAII